MFNHRWFGRVYIVLRPKQRAPRTLDFKKPMPRSCAIERIVEKREVFGQGALIETWPRTDLMATKRKRLLTFWLTPVPKIKIALSFSTNRLETHFFKGAVFWGSNKPSPSRLDFVSRLYPSCDSLKLEQATSP